MGGPDPTQRALELFLLPGPTAPFRFPFLVEFRPGFVDLLELRLMGQPGFFELGFDGRDGAVAPLALLLAGGLFLPLLELPARLLSLEGERCTLRRLLIDRFRRWLAFRCALSRGRSRAPADGQVAREFGLLAERGSSADRPSQDDARLGHGGGDDGGIFCDLRKALMEEVVPRSPGL